MPIAVWKTDMANIHKTETVILPIHMKTLYYYFNDMKARRKLIVLIGIIIGFIVFMLQYPTL
ncbi:MAG TPA: hypothetical protein PLR06_02125 [Cyclobacteriaceae bacterium]|nr:hypothetical protein [Cyclobacteriaceae bacterium]